ncbi:MAG: histidine kinase dimerization/phospho-acceptor domain-containing protein [Candidatus Rokuibacteriota bacterium]
MIEVGRREAIFERLADLEATSGRLGGLSAEARADLAASLTALRASLEEEREADREERHRLSHDLRVPLNAIAGWTHILRLDAATEATVARAADVLDRNVRALTRLIEVYTAAGER